ncbi:putative meiosis-specific protein MEI4-like [Scophthalmus maximus]|uniref:Putative meiosis-specific protein MEI4-like n=1 Tax=Scophthalmus maximus TaxID=52904 RepID=A0A2U9CXT1_SCOMX|nr:putative meiosis-specific protein MEI4-like [Scophthalmus maximus]
MAGGGGQTPSDGGRVTGADEALWFLARARVAVAVAVIKSRPAGMSGREHAEALGRQLRSEDESWRGKAEGLQREVLRLRQELLIARATSVTQGATETAGPDRAVDDASQDLFDTSDAAPDCDSDTPELFLPDHQPAISLPEPDPQTLCALHRVEGSGSGLEALWFSPDGVGGAGESVLADSVCQLLCSVAAACRVPAPPCVCLGDLVPRACRAAARAMDLFCSQRRPSAEFTGRVEESLRELTGLLLHGDQPSEAAETLVTCLVTLGSSNMSRSFLIGHILSQLSAVADQLWQVFQILSLHLFHYFISPLCSQTFSLCAFDASAAFFFLPYRLVATLLVKRADRSHLSDDASLTQASVFQRLKGGAVRAEGLGIALAHRHHLLNFFVIAGIVVGGEDL